MSEGQKVTTMCGAKAGPKMSAPSAAAGATGASGATSAGRGAYADDKLRAAARHRTKELREARRREASTKEDDDLTNPGHDHEDLNPIHDLDGTFDDDDDDGSTDRCSDDNEDDLFTFGASGSAAAAAAAATTRNNPEASPPPTANTSDLIASSLASDNQVLADAAKFLMRVTRMTSPPLPTPPPRSPTNSPSPSPATSEDEEGSHQGSHQSESSSVLGAAKALTGIMGGSARKPSPVPTLPPMTTTLLPTKPSPPPQTTALTPAAAAAARKRSPPPPQTIARKPSPPLSPMQEDEELPPLKKMMRCQEAGASPGPAGRRPLQRMRRDAAAAADGAEQQKRPSLFSRGAPRGTVPGAAAAGGRSLKRQPWSSVPLSLEAERAMEDLQVDWMDWVAPFTTAGTVSRKRARAAAGAETGKEGGEDAKPAAAKEKESPPKKKRARSMSVADLGWMRTTAFCDRNKHSIILPSTPPQQLLNAILACRGYPHRTRPALPTARSRCAVSKPSPLRAASHGPAVLRAVDSSDASALASLLHSGLHPNASDPSGNDTVLSRVCRSADLTLFWLVTEGYGVDSFVSDARGRTPLHHLCSGQGHGNNDDKDPPLVFFTLLHMILERDWRALRVADVDGKTPLDLAGKGSWPAFNRFLQSNVDHYWPRRNGRGVTSWAEIEKEERAFEALVATMSAPTPDPENGLPVEVARGVAAGVVAPDDVVRLRRELEKGKLSATAEEEKASGASPARGSVSLPRTAQQQQNIIAGRSA
mmetsp:Transcript_19724/g.37081  ORF Transcript_19724/g.37081 Transcript_19724/m.37081 type:complete len:761 (-) Transcript_19724:136-2418(-)